MKRDEGRSEERDVDPDAPPSEDELREAAALREALHDPSREHAGAELARAVVLAHRPSSIDAAESERLFARATAGRPAKVVSLHAWSRSWGRVWLAAGTLAVAASLFLLATPRRDARVASLDEPPPARARSAQPLFHEPFAVQGGTSRRIDRIASARAADLRENMFARWDVR